MQLLCKKETDKGTSKKIVIRASRSFTLSVAHHLSAIYPNHHFRVINISLVAVDFPSFLLFHIFSFCSSRSSFHFLCLPAEKGALLVDVRVRPPLQASSLHKSTEFDPDWFPPHCRLLQPLFWVIFPCGANS